MASTATSLGGGDSELRLARRKAMRLFGMWRGLTGEERLRRLERIRPRAPEVHAQLVALVNAEERRHARELLERLARDGEGGELAGRQLGPWTLERAIGAGGMGQVWLAQRSDGLYQGKVAIKMLRDVALDPGAGQRFALEGQMLARLSHPNIARLLDAGVAAGDRRYLVLEYVEGVPIDQSCDGQKLEVAARLRLFRQVCEAVTHAHANLVVHRDLKPSNVLVTSAGQVKLLDFGIAKLLESAEGGAASSPITQWAGAAMTPEYAAPEQLEGGAITTATDVYALGVMLHELLSGARPYSARPVTPTQLAREILETGPLRLSQPARLMRDPAALEAIAARRATTAERLQKLLSGDLEVIVGKALKREPAERYSSAQALSDDLERYLRQQPISARPDSLRYRARKFIRRHWIGTSLTALIGVLIAAGVAGVLWQAQVARREARKAEAASKFLVGLFEANSTEKHSSAEAQNTTARELLDLGRKRLATELKDDPEVRVEMIDTIAEMYWQLGRFAESEELSREKLQLMRALGHVRDLTLARALNNHGMELVKLGRGEDADAEFRAALQILDALGDRDSEWRARVLWSAADQRRQVKPAEAVPLFEEAARILRRFPSSGALPGTFGTLASVYVLVGRIDDATRTLDEGLAITRRQYPAGSLFETALLGRRCEILQAKNRFTEALAAWKDAYQRRRQNAGERYYDTVMYHADYALALARSGAREEGLREIGAVVDLLGSAPVNMSAEYWGRGSFYRARILLRDGDAQGASEALARIDQLWNDKLAKTGRQYGRLLVAQAEERALAGDRAAALDVARRAQALARAQSVPCHTEGWAADAVLARALQASGQLEEALALARQIEACRSADIDDTPIRLAGQLLLARDALLRGRSADALASAQAALERIAGSAERAFYSVEEAEALQLAGDALAALGQRDEARKRLRSAVERLERSQAASSARLRSARDDLAALG